MSTTKDRPDQEFEKAIYIQCIDHYLTRTRIYVTPNKRGSIEAHTRERETALNFVITPSHSRRKTTKSIQSHVEKVP